MWAFLASECLFFGSLISTYLIYRGKSLVGPYPHEVFNIPYTSISAFVLLMSSLTMVLALAALRRGDHRELRIWLMATALLGIVFLGGQTFEFTVFYREGVSLSSNLFGTTFLVLTGFHGAPRDRGGHHPPLLLDDVHAGEAEPGTEPERRAGRPLLALRRRRLDRYLHRDLPCSRHRTS